MCSCLSLSLNHISEEELYQNYQEKALHNDSDEDADSREPKPDNGIVVQYRPLRTSWSQLSVVRRDTHKHTQSCSDGFQPSSCLFCALSVHAALTILVRRTWSFWNSRSLEHAAITSLSTLPYPFSSAPHSVYQGVNSFLGSGRPGGRQTESESQEVFGAPLGIMPMC